MYRNIIISVYTVILLLTHVMERKVHGLGRKIHGLQISSNIISEKVFYLVICLMLELSNCR